MELLKMKSISLNIIKFFSIDKSQITISPNSIKVVIQPGLGNNGRNFGRNHQTSYIIKVQAGGQASKGQAGGHLGRQMGRRGVMSKAG
jgi:hypothetical protein